MKIKYQINKASKIQIYNHLIECDKWFVPVLSGRVDLEKISKKIKENAVVFEAWDEESLIGFVSAYFNDPSLKSGFINNVSVLEAYLRKNIAFTLLGNCIEYGKQNNFSEITLEVSEDNEKALNLYRKLDFQILKTTKHFIELKYIYKGV